MISALDLWHPPEFGNQTGMGLSPLHGYDDKLPAAALPRVLGAAARGNVGGNFPCILFRDGLAGDAAVRRFRDRLRDDVGQAAVRERSGDELSVTGAAALPPAIRDWFWGAAALPPVIGYS